MEDLLGDGIFTVDGKKWKQQRKLASYEFSTKNLKDFSSVVFRKNAVEVSKVLIEVCKANQTVDMQVKLSDHNYLLDSLQNVNDGYLYEYGCTFVFS